MPLGVSEREVYKQVSVPFEPGDLFCFYSDGVTEARERRRANCSVSTGWQETIQTNRHLAPDALIESVRAGRRGVLKSGDVSRRPDVRGRSHQSIPTAQAPMLRNRGIKD